MQWHITGIELIPLHVPFKESIRKVMQEGEHGVGMAIKVDESWLGGDFVICKLYDNEGNIGLGESFVWIPETGISPEQIIDIIKRVLFKYVIGESPFNLEKIHFKMDNNLANNGVSKGLIDIAIYDLIGKIINRPACDLMGGKVVASIPLSALIPLADLDTMVVLAKEFKKMGFTSLRYKLGQSVQKDIEISKAIRDVVGEEVRLRVDYNQAYKPSEAVNAIRAIEKYNIDFAEQPVRADDYLGMSYVQKRINIPLMAHEGFFSLKDFITLVELDAVGVLGINSERPGGITKALKAINYAEQKGIYTVIHNQPLGIGSAVHIHLATAKFYSLGYETELFGQVMMEDDLIKKPIIYKKGFARVPEGNGWGVELDESVIEKYNTNTSIQIGKCN
ncbi:MAG: mandelate racemase/muconate lactonizing enzyme family protein [Candidatus Helarchaeota archaeon]